MKLIAWDTSSKSGCLVAIEGDLSQDFQSGGVQLVSEMSFNVDSTHSERLLWGIHQVLESARWKITDIDLFAVGIGPGSFTGLRIGITTARTFAHTLKKPLIPVSSLAALARPAGLQVPPQNCGKTLVISTTDACKGELFALWGDAEHVSKAVVNLDSSQSKLWSPELKEMVLNPDELIQYLIEFMNAFPSEMRWIGVGEGRHRYKESWEQLPKSLEIKNPNLFGDFIQGRYLGMLAWEAAQAGISPKALDISPRYLRVSDAERKLTQGLLKHAPVGMIPVGFSL